MVVFVAFCKTLSLCNAKHKKHTLILSSGFIISVFQCAFRCVFQISIAFSIIFCLKFSLTKNQTLPIISTLS